jgi:hypothetical protein
MLINTPGSSMTLGCNVAVEVNLKPAGSSKLLIHWDG